MPYPQDNQDILLDAVTTASTGSIKPFSKGLSSIQCSGRTTSGTGAATVLVEVSNDNINWLTAVTFTLILGTTSVTDGTVVNASWRYMRGKVSSISGTGAAVTLVSGD